MNGTERLGLRTKKNGALLSNMQKLYKSQSRINWLPSYVRISSLTMVNFSNLERVDIIMLYGVADGDARLARQLWILC